MTPLQKKTTLLALAAFAVAAPLAACSTPAADSSTDPGTTDSTESTTSGEYTDGEYTESGSYQSPNGSETIEVTLSLESNVITAVEVTGNASNPNTERYQGEFIDGIAAEVVGKNIDEISVDRVAGSSLTSGGFNDAVEQIKADATA